MSTESLGTVLNVPFRSQYDSSPYANANCGPASLGMVFGAFGLSVSNERIRAIADRLQGTTSYNDGIALDVMAAIAQQAGLKTEGLYGSDGRYRQWSMADLVREVRAGHPIITLVRYSALPDHSTSLSQSDHYIVVVGLSADGFIVNDPAFDGNGGYRRPLAPGALLDAWKQASIKEQAIAFLPPNEALALAPDGAAGTLALPPGTPTRWTAPQILPTAPSGERARVSGVAPAMPTFVLQTGAPTSIPTPTIMPLTEGWRAALAGWQHTQPSAPAPALPTIPPLEPAKPTVVVLADQSSSPLGGQTLTFLIVGLVLSGAVAILRAPRPDAD